MHLGRSGYLLTKVCRSRGSCQTNAHYPPSRSLSCTPPTFATVVSNAPWYPDPYHNAPRDGVPHGTPGTDRPAHHGPLMAHFITFSASRGTQDTVRLRAKARTSALFDVYRPRRYTGTHFAIAPVTIENIPVEVIMSNRNLAAPFLRTVHLL